MQVDTRCAELVAAALEALFHGDADAFELRARLVDDIDKGNGESILIYAAYEKAYKDKAGEIRAASYFWNDRLIGVGLTYLGPVEGEDRAQEVALAENMLRNVEIIH